MLLETAAKLSRGVNDRIDLASEPFFRLLQDRLEILETQISYDQQVDIALGLFRGTSHGTKDEGRLNPLVKGHELLLKYSSKPSGFLQKTLQILEDRALAVGLNIQAPPVAPRSKNSRHTERIDLTL